MTGWQTVQVYGIIAVFFVILTAIIVSAHLPIIAEAICGFVVGAAMARVYLLLSNDVIKSNLKRDI